MGFRSVGEGELDEGAVGGVGEWSEDTGSRAGARGPVVFWGAGFEGREVEGIRVLGCVVRCLIAWERGDYAARDAVFAGVHWAA